MPTEWRLAVALQVIASAFNGTAAEDDAAFEMIGKLIQRMDSDGQRGWKSFLDYLQVPEESRP